MAQVEKHHYCSLETNWTQPNLILTLTQSPNNVVKRLMSKIIHIYKYKAGRIIDLTLMRPSFCHDSIVLVQDRILVMWGSSGLLVDQHLVVATVFNDLKSWDSANAEREEESTLDSDDWAECHLSFTLQHIFPWFTANALQQDQSDTREK